MDFMLIAERIDWLLCWWLDWCLSIDTKLIMPPGFYTTSSSKQLASMAASSLGYPRHIWHRSPKQWHQTLNTCVAMLIPAIRDDQSANFHLILRGCWPVQSVVSCKSRYCLERTHSDYQIGRTWFERMWHNRRQGGWLLTFQSWLKKSNWELLC